MYTEAWYCWNVWSLRNLSLFSDSYRPFSKASNICWTFSIQFILTKLFFIHEHLYLLIWFARCFDRSQQIFLFASNKIWVYHSACHKSYHPFGIQLWGFHGQTHFVQKKLQNYFLSKRGKGDCNQQQKPSNTINVLG